VDYLSFFSYFVSLCLVVEWAWCLFTRLTILVKISPIYLGVWLICWVIVDRFPSINHRLRLPLFRLALDSLLLIDAVPIYYFDCKQKDASNLLSLCTFELFRSIFHVCQSFRLSKSLGTSVVVFFKSLSKAPSSLYFPLQNLNFVEFKRFLCFVSHLFVGMDFY